MTPTTRRAQLRTPSSMALARNQKAPTMATNELKRLRDVHRIRFAAIINRVQLASTGA